MPTIDQLVQVIQNLQQEVQALRSQQADLKTAAATHVTASLAKDAPGHCDHRAGMKPQRPASFNSKKKRLQNFLLYLDVYAQLAKQH